MITYFEGTVFNAPAQTIVNPVNAEGLMSGGLSREFSLRYPEMISEYQSNLKTGRLSRHRPTLHTMYPTQILSFVTKEKMSEDAKLEYIEAGLKYFVDNYKEAPITSIAFPKLGTGLGKLEWTQVKPIMEKYLQQIEGIPVYLCLNEQEEPMATEKIMLDRYKKIIKHDVETISKSFNISKELSLMLKDAEIPERFYHLMYLDNLSDEAYNEIFKILFEPRSEQTKFTDTTQSELRELNIF